MKFKNLIENHDWKDISISLLNLYPDEAEMINGFKKAYDELITLEPNETDFVISIKYVIDDELSDNWHHVHGYSKSDESKQFWGLDLDKWENWLGMDIDKITLENYSQIDIVAHCIWEMTFWGFDQQTIQNTFKDENVNGDEDTVDESLV